MSDHRRGCGKGPAAGTAEHPTAAAIGSSGATTEADFRGPREAWERLGLAIRRGDKDAALKELTPAAKLRLAPVFETIGSKSTPLNVEELGSIRGDDFEVHLFERTVASIRTALSPV